MATAAPQRGTQLAGPQMAGAQMGGSQMAGPQLALPSGERQPDASVTVYGVIVLGIAAVVVLGALMGAWLALRSGTKVWPPQGVRVENYFGTTLSITMLLSLAGGWWALYGTSRDERGQASVALLLTIFMDLAFINLLTYVMRGAHFGPSTSTYGVMYYAVNVAVVVVAASGILVAGVALARVLGGQVTARQPALAWSAAWYGTGVVVAWFVVYTMTYVVK